MVHRYKDGKMAMENSVGNVVYMKDGVTMETTDGKTIQMTGNEIARLSAQKYQEKRK
jgi:hypothetical protein